MGASEHWLPIYRATGMHDIYIGDEAVVDVQEFSLAGGQMKGLRQAYNRIAKYGYTVSFHDPARLDRDTASQLAGLMAQGRRGEFERGLLHGARPHLRPPRRGPHPVHGDRARREPRRRCASSCPARGIGGYSLDLMRRDRGRAPQRAHRLRPRVHDRAPPQPRA